MPRSTPPPWGRMINAYQRAIMGIFRRYGRLTPARLAEIGDSPAFTRAAGAAARDMVMSVVGINARSWREAAMRGTRSREIYRHLRTELRRTGAGDVIDQIVNDNAQLITSIPTAVAEQITAFAARAQQKGMRAGEIEAELRRRAPRLAASRIKLIARTEVSKAETAMTRARSERLDIPWYQWETSHDQRVRPSHRRMHNVLVAWNDPPSPEALVHERPVGRYAPGEIWNCFTGDVEAFSRSGVKTLWRAPYSGDLIRIDVEGGVSFTATPNHPILTANGWRAAGSLDIGCDLVRLLNTGRSAVEPDMSDGISTFEEMFAALARDHQNIALRRFGADFHGDVIRDEIDQVSIADDLTLECHSAPVHGFGDLMLAGTDGGIRGLIAGVALQMFGSYLSRIADQMTAFICGQTLHPDAIGFGPVSRHDVVGDEIFPHHCSLYSEMQRDSLLAPSVIEIEPPKFSRIDDMPHSRAERLLTAESGFGERIGKVTGPASFTGGDIAQGFSGDQALIRVTQKSVCKSSGGHVFTMETNDGWYAVTSAGIISRNCRCLALPLVSLDEVRWPAEVYSGGSITRMTRATFERRFLPRAA